VQGHYRFSAELEDAIEEHRRTKYYGASKTLVVEDLLRAALGLCNYQVASGMLRGGGRR
jgi:hypothetical protein